MSPERHSLPWMAILLTATGCASTGDDAGPARWLAGDHHIHSRYSVGWDDSTDPPSPVIGGDAIYAIDRNAEMARAFGLEWMVATDHGGPNHSKVNLEQAYPELLESRDRVPEVVQFMGLELNTPGADHSSIIVPHTHDEGERLYEYERRFDKYEPWPNDGARDNEDLMIDALSFVDEYPTKPIVIAHHPSRSAPALGEYGLTSPAELRRWNDAAPDVAVGMEGAPGHQAATISERGYNRGAYGRGFPTLGGFDQMTAELGGFWDSMLGEGRRWWITANSDSHVHYTEGGIDFWPGEYSKTWVFAQKDHDAILESLRAGRIFVTLGDLINDLTFSASAGSHRAELGETLEAASGEQVTINIRVRDPGEINANGDDPKVARIDLIGGEITGPVADQSAHQHQHTRVLARFDEGTWQRDGEYLTMAYTMTVTGPLYVRLRGTNTDQLEPEPDVLGEDPWQDLWFYSNPVFISTLETSK